MYDLYDRILGGLLGAGAGDAMGAATEARTTEQILEYFGHEVTDFETPPMDTFGAGNVPGQLTDDFSSAYFVAKHIVDNDGIVREDVVQKALIDWSEHPVFFDRFAGPTTRLAIRRYKGEKIRRCRAGDPSGHKRGSHEDLAKWSSQCGKHRSGHRRSDYGYYGNT